MYQGRELITDHGHTSRPHHRRTWSAIENHDTMVKLLPESLQTLKIWTFCLETRESALLLVEIFLLSQPNLMSFVAWQDIQ